MRLAFIVILLQVSVANGNESPKSLLMSLVINRTTPADLETIFSEVDGGSLKNRSKQFSCTKGTGVYADCYFYRDRLYRYEVTLSENSDELKDMGGVDALAASVGYHFGKPFQAYGENDSFRAWDLGGETFIINTQMPDVVLFVRYSKNIDVAAKTPYRRGGPKLIADYGPPPPTSYDFTGWRRGYTKSVELTKGRYHIVGSQRGKGNFIVYLETSNDKRLLLNEVGPHAYDTGFFTVNQDRQATFFVQKCNGTWNFTVRKVD